ncbi:ribonuclease HII [Roseivirga pacifica]|uniref:ribonuclease HII n=1 Tax=Roseivirga pacifica TaxID=1267423 RepID=UPI0020963789|nr:ribonuclease HII [Roseivirga pacifica]MCO6360179.1 ribonuclease HII [Roseivirga pacifica]MCO6367550.1 ribonuclease HII [Roseivirga pacifica]MCO6369918.1 ribonuclease HII [Roseivirga pacifica]MCO6375207.1 ribonuclease HII [Roseivirga pacifica]MCO6380465.1 ribonuclease HII [Roseivirga pacifica]
MLAKDFGSGKIEAGCDEAGRGPLAGPVVAAAVILPDGYEHELLNDSKKLSQKKLDLLEEEIKKNALAYHVTEVSPEEIDEVNILNASFLAMHRAIEQLATTPELLLIDGNKFKPYKDVPHECIVKGDGKYMSIAAASILAKTHRDRVMRQAAQQYPGYGWEKNVGYPTKQHREAIKKIGITPLHRKSFRLLPEQMELF